MSRLIGVFAFVLAALAGAPAGAADERRAVFAGGCFWCVEADFDKLEGVLATTSGFAGGRVENPTYEEVTYGDTGHLEVVEVRYDPDVVAYAELVAYHLRHIDPLDAGGQFCDRGESYTTAVFYSSADEKAAANAAVAEAEAALGETVATTVRELTAFYPAEDYHQDYYEKNPLRYRFYRTSCGRDRRVRQVWGDAAS